MNKRLLLDGCSLTYGLNLSKHETLEHHFIELGYEVTNFSRPGKSNQAIAHSVYENINNFDILVVGWTFSSRWYLQYHKHNIDLLATRENIELPFELDVDQLEQSYRDLHRSLYSLFDITYWNRASDMLIDFAYSFANKENKKIVFFSWESRNVTSPVFYPHIAAHQRLPCGHLNADATTTLFNNLTHLIEK